VRGLTALCDAVGTTIEKFAAIRKKEKGKPSPDKVLFVVITDGEENSSKEYTASKVKKLIRKREKTDGWEFLFLGANIDAAEEAEKIGIPEKRARTFRPDAPGLTLNFRALNDAVVQIRSRGEIPDDWAAEIEADLRSRDPGDKKPK
jgi:ADP-heptose:LPS heptosyltransferase